MNQKTGRPTSAHAIRRAFLDFFHERGHRVVPSHGLIPPGDPTLYFINAGMVPFKDVFTGERKVDDTRAVSCQKCLRVSGKHNDLENVGHTPRHHTFFEMLGNFSFGDYFKAEAIQYGWSFLVDVLELPADYLHVTIYPGDEEARRHWLDDVGIPAERLHEDPENLWAMGDTGPCGRCSEIHIDLGVLMSDAEPVAWDDPRAEERFLELWNLVFMESEALDDGSTRPLPSPSIDTGMGLERVAAVVQGSSSNFDTDLFVPIIEAVAERAGVRYGADEDTDVALRVIADHSRATAFLVADGVYPENEGRGYVLRRIMRRAIRFGRHLGITDPLLVDTTQQVVDMMGEHYPELVERRETIRRMVAAEEERFGRTIQAGLRRLDQALQRLEAEGRDTLEGRVAFELYDTHGFPLDLTQLICAERGVSVDEAGFHEAMAEQRERARAASGFGHGDVAAYRELADEGVASRFTGYDTDVERSPVRALLVGGERVERAEAGDEVEVVVDRTPFYPEGGGQVGDVGTIRVVGQGSVGQGAGRVRVEDTQKPWGELIVHRGRLEEGAIAVDDEVDLAIDVEARELTRRNHTATHLLHYALRTVLGDHVQQRGSLVAPHRLRFDFSHTGAMTAEEIAEVDRLVNELVQRNEPVRDELVSYEQAVEKGAIAFFGEKYGEKVRVLKAGSESMELCGGTHARATGDIGFFKILSETGISSGVRRLEVATGMDALRWVQEREGLLQTASEELNVQPEQMLPRVEKLVEERKQLADEAKQARVDAQLARAESSLDDAREINGYRVAAVRLDGVGGKELRALGEKLRNKIGRGAVLLAAVDGSKVSLLVGATKDAAERVDAGSLIGELAPLVGGKGGGRSDIAQAGGGDVEGVDDVIEAFHERVAQRLSA